MFHVDECGIETGHNLFIKDGKWLGNYKPAWLSSYPFEIVTVGKKGIVTFLEVSAQLGILAVFASLLMIAGEFDLSVGSMIGFAGVAIAIPVTEFGWPIWAAMNFSRNSGSKSAESASGEETEGLLIELLSIKDGDDGES